MGCDTVFSGLMHLLSPDLHFERLSRGSNQRGMERLVHIRLGHGNIVLEPAGDRLI